MPLTSSTESDRFLIPETRDGHVRCVRKLENSNTISMLLDLSKATKKASREWSRHERARGSFCRDLDGAKAMLNIEGIEVDY